MIAPDPLLKAETPQQPTQPFEGHIGVRPSRQDEQVQLLVFVHTAQSITLPLQIPQGPLVWVSRRTAGVFLARRVVRYVRSEPREKHQFADPFPDPFDPIYIIRNPDA